MAARDALLRAHKDLRPDARDLVDVGWTTEQRTKHVALRSPDGAELIPLPSSAGKRAIPNARRQLRSAIESSQPCDEPRSTDDDVIDLVDVHDSSSNRTGRPVLVYERINPRELFDHTRPPTVEQRRQSRLETERVRRYLEALLAADRCGREEVEAQRRVVRRLMDTADSLRRQQALHRRLRELDVQLKALQESEGDFVRSVAGYADRKGICRAAFVEMGVPEQLLDQAGLVPPSGVEPDTQESES